jgi:Putative amidase domain
MLAASLILLAPLPGQTTAYAGYGSSFNRSGAVSYTRYWYNSYNPKYENLDSRGGDCTNFLSQGWHEGGGIPFDNSGANQWYSYGTWEYGLLTGWVWVWRTTGTFVRVRDFRSYWYTFGTYYKHVEGSTALRAAYSPALLGDAYVYDSGSNPDAPSWAHSNMEVGWWTGYDMYSQHSPPRDLRDWRSWLWSLTADRQMNFFKPGHGIRVIAP